MHGNFPPPEVPQIPDDFEYWLGGEIDEEEDEEEGDGEGEVSLDYAHQNDMDEREYRFYADMYEP